MNSAWGSQIVYSLFGESHGPMVGITIHHLPAGVKLDRDWIRRELDLRKPGRDDLSTPRKESDDYEIVSGVLEGITTGAPLTILIKSENQRSRDYSEIRHKMRPSHSDYPAWVKYSGFNDYRGGGHFSARLTAPIVAAGAIAAQILSEDGIEIETRIDRIGHVQRGLGETEVVTEAMREEILSAKKDHDSVGGTVSLWATGTGIGMGEPFFHSVESVLAQLYYSIPGVKGVLFGAGALFSESRGSQVNDQMRYQEGTVQYLANFNGGINGGISNGMPIEATLHFKPTPSIGKIQKTVDVKERRSVDYAIVGRHDPCIVPRALPVVRAMTAIGLLELKLSSRTAKGE